MEVHELFQCKVCPKAFNARNRYKYGYFTASLFNGEPRRLHLDSQHLKTHTKPYACHSCEKGFALRADLHRHVKSRHRVGQTKFDCDVAGCTFKAKRKDNLTQHKKLHSTGKETSSAVKPSQKRSPSQVVLQSGPQQKVPDAAASLDSSCLMQAASTGSVVFLAHALRTGINVNTKSSDGFTALHCAARADQVEALNYLLSMGADPTCMSGTGPKSKGTQPVHQAVEGKSFPCFEILLQFGSDFTNHSSFNGLLECVARLGDMRFVRLLIKHCAADYDPSKWVAMFAMEAAKVGRVEIIELLHYYGISSLPGEEQSAHHSPLYQAAKHGHLAVVCSLLASTKESSDHRSRFLNLRSRSLRRATKNGHIGVVKVLLDSGYKSNVLGRCALQHAASNGHAKAVELLVCRAGVDVNLRFTGLDTVLHLAARAGHLQVVELLLQQVGIASMSGNENGETPLLAAFWQSQLETVRLLSKYDASPNLQDIDFINSSISQIAKQMLDRQVLNINTWGSRKSLLHLAAGLDDLNLLKFILRHRDLKPDALSATDYDGATPLDVAKTKGNNDIIEILLTHGASEAAVEPGNAPLSDNRPLQDRRAYLSETSETEDGSETLGSEDDSDIDEGSKKYA